MHAAELRAVLAKLTGFYKEGQFDHAQLSLLLTLSDRKLSRKPFAKLRIAYSVKLVFSYVVKGIKIKIKFRASRRLHFEDT